MSKIKSFDQFVNEGADLLSVARSLAADLLSGRSLTGGSPDSGSTTSGGMVTIGGSTPATTTQTQITTPLTTVPGNDDFTLYMQHQQGIAGAKGLIQASHGAGQLASDTIKTKAGKKYANLVMNIPSDRPQVKTDLIKALDAGDQRTAALLFLNMWKEKWASKSKQAQTLINDPKNAAVKQAIAKYAQKYGVPFDFAATVANIESGFNPNSGNNRYKGLYALSQEEFNKYVPGGNIHDIDNNANAGLQCLRNNIKAFKKYLGPTLATLNLGSWTNNIA
jgi:soluble lytic murein transglycosylase-like protein